MLSGSPSMDQSRLKQTCHFNIGVPIIELLTYTTRIAIALSNYFTVSVPITLPFMVLPLGVEIFSFKLIPYISHNIFQVNVYHITKL